MWRLRAALQLRQRCFEVGEKWKVANIRNSSYKLAWFLGFLDMTATLQATVPIQGFDSIHKNQRRDYKLYAWIEICLGVSILQTQFLHFGYEGYFLTCWLYFQCYTKTVPQALYILVIYMLVNRIYICIVHYCSGAQTCNFLSTNMKIWHYHMYIQFQHYILVYRQQYIFD